MRGTIPLAVVVLVATSCGAPSESAIEAATTTTRPDTISTIVVTTPDEKDVAIVDDAATTRTTPLYEAGDIDPGLQPFIERARADLATRLDVDVDEISTHAAVLVIWPDGSLGCPRPGMQYAQVTTDGSIIELRHGDDTYRYHSGGQRDPFLCANPLTTAPPPG